MTVVVTGASGFLGSALVKRLLSDDTVTVAISGPRTRKPDFAAGVTWIDYQADLPSLAKQIAERNPRVVVHCATYYVLTHKPNDVAPMFDANLRFGTHLLESLSATSTHFVNLSTYFQLQRSATGDYTSLYALSKSMFSSIAQWYAANTSVKVADLTLFDTYGPGDKRKKLIPSLLACAKSGEFLKLNSTSAAVDLCYIDDVVSALALAVKNQLTGSWSVRSSQLMTVADIARAIEGVTGRQIVGECNNNKKVSELPAEAPPVVPHWQPNVGLLEGISRCWKAIQAVA